jgi:hypothetical protein
MSKRTGKAISLTDLLDEIPWTPPLLLQFPSPTPGGIRPGPGRPAGQRKPGVLCPVCPRPHMHADDLIFWLYLLDFAMVGADICIYFRNRKLDCLRAADTADDES